MSTLPTPPATPQLRATTPGATPSLSSTTTTPPATPPHSPVSQLTPASTNTSLASNTTQATNAPPGTTSTAAATEKSKSPSVFSSIASSIFSTVSSIFTYLGKMKEKFKKKMENFVGFFRGLTDEERAALRPTAKDQEKEMLERAKGVEEFRAGEHLNTLQQVRQEAAFDKQEVETLRGRVNAYEKKASEERRQAFDAMRK